MLGWNVFEHAFDDSNINQEYLEPSLSLLAIDGYRKAIGLNRFFETHLFLLMKGIDSLKVDTGLKSLT